MDHATEQMHDESETDSQNDPFDKMGAIVGRLENLALEQVSKKVHIEDRWYEDTRQFYGQYDPSTLAKLKAANKSKAYIKLTRSKTNTFRARLSDMLFPTDDKNWGIKPTPVPELATQAADKPDMSGFQDGEEVPSDVAKQLNEAQKAQAQMDEARKRSAAMQEEIEDQLRESKYNIKCRDSIKDACKLGTAVMKGPTAGGRSRRSWQTQYEAGEDEKNNTPIHVLVDVENNRPEYTRVDPWGYFPDMSSRTPEESEFEFERHLKNKKELRKMARKPGFSSAAIREILKEDPRDTLPTYETTLRDITGSGQESLGKRYHVWEYHGPISKEEMKTICECSGEEDLIEEEQEDDDPLDDVDVVIFFCQGKVLKIGIHHLDSGDSLYSVFNLEKDDTSQFGYGIPFLMRDSDRATNAAWRMLLDNAGLSTGPQIVVDNTLIEPADGNWELTPRKIWLKKKEGGSVRDAFGVYHIDSRQNELANIVEMAKGFADEETSLPMIAQGEQGAHVTQTQGGMAMLMNAANVVFRDVVRNFDDDMTTPNIHRVYDWNMQFSKKEHIKGDFDVDARGSSVLLVREVQAQNLMAMAMNFSAHPVLGPLTKIAPLYRKLVQAHMLSADEIVYTDTEIKEMTAKQNEGQGQEPSPEQVKMQGQIELKTLEHDQKKELATIERDTALIVLAQKQGMDLETLQAKLSSDERLFAAEAAIKNRHGQGI